MKKLFILLAVLFVCGRVWSGELGLPVEQLALPAVQQGDYLVCVWDDSLGDWVQGHQAYDHSGSFNFQLPAWGKWYWVGLWDVTNGEYVFGKWVGHFLTN